MPKKIKDKTIYDENSIISINPREFCRLRPSTYLGDNSFSTQLVREAFANSLDEHIIGHGNLITININTRENSYSVEDNGQGFIVNSMRNDKKTVLEAAFSVLNTSGKYDDSTNGVYGGSALGCNGVGAKIITFLSLTTDIITYNNNEFEHIWFKDGIFEKRETGKLAHESGTKISWIPDPQFFQNKEANILDLKKLFEDISALCPNLNINLIVDDVLTSYHSANGIKDLVDDKISKKEILKTRFAVKKIDENNLFDIVLTYTSDYSENIIAYANFGLTESGVHISTLKAAITYQINKYAQANNLLKKNTSPITQAELSEGLFIVFNIKTSNIKYDSQTKTRVVDLNKSLITQTMSNEFADWLNNNPKDANLIIDKALLARKVKLAAQKTKDGIRNAGIKGKKFISLPTKLVDAYSKQRSECSLYICEGDSAAANLITKRDGKTQAVFPIRGKVLSCRKASIDKIYSNQEIANICKAIGLDVDKNTGKLVYDIKKLRYNQIILACDGDIDGKNIRSLLINMFWEVCKELVINGHIYVALPPLFKITTSKNEYVFLRDEKALAEYKKKHSKEKYIIQRAKGLGECSADEIKYCLLDPNTRNVQQIVVKDEVNADNLLECFFGNDIPIRRKFLLDHYNERNDELQIYNSLENN